MYARRSETANRLTRPAPCTYYNQTYPLRRRKLRRARQNYLGQRESSAVIVFSRYRGIVLQPEDCCVKMTGSTTKRSIMRVALSGRHLDDLRTILADFPVEVVSTDPDLVISYGGDGALLGAERQYPGIPKLPLRDRRTAPKCPCHSEEAVLTALFDGSLKSSRLMKLIGEDQTGTRVIGINDVVIGKGLIHSAVRFRLWLDGELYEHQIVGDGVVVATPFGSTGWYRCITRSFFRSGIGIAFNNSMEPLDHLVLPDSAELEVQILRGPAVLLADNDPVRISLDRGHRARIYKADSYATVLGLDIFRCQQCYRLRQQQIELA